ncbi:sugar phosphate isomerase/epimerase [Alicyclobacillus fastidiosus]|uniref:Sugar phosphate isomerase/epimerase n=1 Tax=Alicyclobacillus fastidiosus TaxID=392011 RepID=A0ABY6ZG61_9BACL|nr:sugar phosphate isomerase/epimerase family protein [Alicyclobacillus fastidiosus]WAH41196.1 sugar phosphate isomerase/epimerase [Alicyclobacillus fastidiosus]GMA62774.1 sugar phosphate isomerase [Alicyclobacillus fastidiosus]
MKIGLSTYSFYRELKSGEMSVLDVIEWIADNGGEHVEIVPMGYRFEDQPELIERIRETAQRVKIDISNYAIAANFAQEDDEAYEAEIERVMKEVDVASRLGVRLMRHDVAWRPVPEATIHQFERDLPRLKDACRRVAMYAESYGITTSVENHGFFVQHSDRVQRLVEAVARDNFKTTLDVGNFLCVDENPFVATQKNLPYASMVHLKDFYVRSPEYDPGQGWFCSSGGNYLRGAIVGHGDTPMWQIVKAIKESGYDGYISIEFEGMEDSRTGSKIGMENARRIWDKV